MLHGMVDNNVNIKMLFVYHSFIELGKKNWSLSSFPVEAHGFKNLLWVDEYSRILNLFNTTLLENSAS
jgi:dipeptidyl aminopeptidase/acylaminoacyl peptidase